MHMEVVEQLQNKCSPYIGTKEVVHHSIDIHCIYSTVRDIAW